ncbi:hypothetical protein MJO28_006758 [Puccinia striiformis f. sp. tritici]|uniref:Uncharacterized protein n=1 Tax=Puccinia striiformis f. sp. tritici TaxID=168172 RepID=A0ACC0EHY7_9BASI|nr:hypothetical protein MJO28_017534 [Puccinia striiformis f. sp. tritici]KAI7954211.1 hypothetical protein MJO28_006758 [Puccinia striiformis f. sp. tritici]
MVSTYPSLTGTKTVAVLVLSLGLGYVNGYQCPEENQEEKDDHGFFRKGSLDVGEWDAHHIGWAAAGVAASIATIASLANIYLHCKNYNKPLEQRQIVRILLMPVIYSISSFFAYRYYRHYVYFAIIRDTYEAFVLASFLILCLLYVGRSPLEQKEVMKQKEKSSLVFPFCCFRYRPSKPYFLVATKWSVLQYVILRPLISATALITDTQKVFCASSYSPHFANLWLTILIFISATLALYGLLITKHLAKEDLEGHRPTCKFMSIKIAVFLVFYQSFLLSFFDHQGLFKATEYWSRSNIADGVNALATTVEMAIVGVFQLYAFPYTEYRALIKGSEINRQKSVWKNFLHSQDYRDFGQDILMGVGFIIDRMRGAEYTKSRNAAPHGTNGLDFQAAFGLDPEHSRIRDSEWDQEHPRLHSESDPQKGWATFSSHAQDQDVWDAKMTNDADQLDHNYQSHGDEPIYESIKLGNVESQYGHTIASPPYRTDPHESPFLDQPNNIDSPDLHLNLKSNDDLDTLVVGSSTPRLDRDDSDDSNSNHSHEQEFFRRRS